MTIRPPNFSVSIHAPRVGRDASRLHVFEDGYVSIHAPRVGRDGDFVKRYQRLGKFQSTRPVRGATSAPRTSSRSRSFNPRAPCGARPLWEFRRGWVMWFQSTRTWRGLVRQACIQKIGSEGSISEPIAHIKITGARCYTVLRLLYFTYSFFH